MKNKLKKFLVTIIISLFCFTLAYTGNSLIPKLEFQTIKEENMNVDVVFIGFDPDYSDREEYSELLSTSIDPYVFHNDSFPQSIYNVSYNFHTLSPSAESDFFDYVESVSTQESFVEFRVNESAIDEYELAGEYDSFNDLVIPCAGTMIDARAVESYMESNLYTGNEPDPNYTLYLMNFSHLDNADHSLEHAYSYSLPDCDAIEIDPDHFSTTNIRTTIGWGGNQRFCYVDISAISMFMLYYTLIFEANVSTAPLYTLYDLDSYTQTLNLTAQEDRSNLRLYISQWIDTYTKNVFLSQAVYIPPISENFNLPIAVFDNISGLGYTPETVSWAISPDRIESYLRQGFPWINWNVEVIFYDLNDYPELRDHLSSHVQTDENGYFIDIYNITEIIDQKLGDFFDLDSKDVQLPTVIFLNQEVRFTYGGINIGGLAVGDYQLLVRQPSQFFFDGDISQPRSGLTHTIVHEIGHNLGLDHPHNNEYGYGSMYVEDVMSYKFTSNNFSIFTKDAVGRFQFDYYYMIAQDNISKIENTNIIGYNKILDFLQQSYEAYLEMDYETAVILARDAYNLVNKLDNPFRKPAILTGTIIGSVGFAVVLAIVSIRFKLPSKIGDLVRKKK